MRKLLYLVLVTLIFSRQQPISDKGCACNLTEDKKDMRSIYISEDDLYYLTLLTLHEARGESVLGQKLVIDTVLNRVDSDLFPNSIQEVIFQPGQYTNCLYNNYSSEEYYITSQYVLDECCERTDYDVLYFCATGYNGPVPLYKEGGHYFSGQ